MRQMLGREFVQSRLGEDGAGISYAEFSYSLIQGYDFLHLFKEHGVTLQICGADQWGNSIAGVDLIRRIAGSEAHVWSTPLVINRATGKKFGKTEDGAVWLNPEKTSIYKFYQFWINADDEGVEEYMKIYTTLDKETIEDILEAHNESKGARLAQKHLAYEVTKLVHGAERADSVRRISEALFGGQDYDELTIDDFEALKQELPAARVQAGTLLVDVLVETALASSKAEARRFLEASAVYLNGLQFSSEKTVFDSADAIRGHAVIRRGKNQNAVVEFV
jgi:tyrosyl-tRNA synthetase